MASHASVMHPGRCLAAQDLCDLRTLFEHVARSDVVVLLGTEAVLTRPWCVANVVSFR